MRTTLGNCSGGTRFSLLYVTGVRTTFGELQRTLPFVLLCNPPKMGRTLFLLGITHMPDLLGFANPRGLL
jgi:hypothetical protein